MIKTYNKGDRTYLAENFQAKEFDCKGGECSLTYIDTDLVNYLQQIRTHFGAPVNITSAYRCAAHNKRVGGATNSYHTKGQAADFYINGVDTLEIAKYAESLGIKGIGHYDTFVHIDTRVNKSFWYSSNEEYRSTFGGAPIQTTTPAPVVDNSKKEALEIISKIETLLAEVKEKLK